MDTRTGEIRHFEEGEAVPKNFVPVNRPLTVREYHKAKINKYSPCACGSGKKFKFCCFKP